MTKLIDCPDCDATGVVDDHTCNECEGERYVPATSAEPMEWTDYVQDYLMD